MRHANPDVPEPAAPPVPGLPGNIVFVYSLLHPLNRWSLRESWGRFTLTIAVFVGFVLGKPLGIVLFRWLAVHAKIALRPPDLSWRLIAGGGQLAGIGFTMALFIANLAFSESVLGSAKLGILRASVFSAVADLAMLMWLPARAKSL